MIHSFDVFDTLVTRKVASPEHIFLLVAERALISLNFQIDPQIFKNARVKAEQILYGRDNHRVKLRDIYTKLSDSLELSAHTAKQLADLELQVEFENLLPIPKSIQLVNDLRARGETIIYTSDMYLSEKEIKKILTDHDIYQEPEKVFVSCEYGAWKGDGKLFHVVAEEMSVSTDQIIHYGNNFKADVKGAKKAGAAGKYVKEANLNRYETYLSEVNNKFRMDYRHELEYSGMAAASRYSRLNREGNEKSEIFDVASAVAAPLLYKFVANVLENSRGDTICFLARDGYIMYLIARKLIDEGFYNKSIKYIHVSREVLVLPSINKMDEDEVTDHIFSLYYTETLYQALISLSVNEETIAEAEIDEKLLNQSLLKIDRKDLREVINNSVVFAEISANADDKKERLIAYLEAEGLFESNILTLVDVGWSLTSQNLMTDLLKEDYGGEIEGFYIGINESADSSLKNGRKSGYIWDLRKSSATIDAPRVIQIIEAFCSAPQGRTLDYTVNSSSVTPVSSEQDAGHLIEWGHGVLEEGILSSLRYKIEFGKRVEQTKWDTQIISDLLKLFWVTPTRDEVKAWGRYPNYVCNQRDKVIRLFTEKPFLKLLKRILINGKLPNKKMDQWPHANIYSLPPLKRILITQSLSLKRTAHHVKKDLLSERDLN